MKRLLQRMDNGLFYQNESTWTADQKAARKKQIEEAFSPWDGSHKGLTKVIKKSMNDPKSYDHDKTVYADMGDYLIVTTTFRGKNAFGGVIKNTWRAKCDLDGNVIEVHQIMSD